MIICCTLLPTFVFQLLHEIVTGTVLINPMAVLEYY